MAKTVAIEIGHWYNPADRRFPGYGTDENGDVWWEFKFNYVVGKELIRQLERHGITTIVNGDFSVIGNTPFNTAFDAWENLFENNQFHRGKLGGIPTLDGEKDENGNSIQGFVSYLKGEIAQNKIQLDAAIAVHFNAVDSHDAQGFVIADDKNSTWFKESDALSKCIEKEIDYLILKKLVYERLVRLPSAFAMHNVPCPVAYCEFGFYDYEEDRKLFNNEKTLKEYGTAAAKGILAYLGETWLEETLNIHICDKKPNQEEFDKIPNKTLIVVHCYLHKTHDYEGMWRVNDGHLFWKGNVTSFGGLAHTFNDYNHFTSAGHYEYFEQSSPFWDMAFLAFPMEKDYKGIEGLHVINCGRLFYNAKSRWGRVYAFEQMPSKSEYEKIPDKSLIVIHFKNCFSKQGRVYDNLHVVQDGKLFYKDLSYVGIQSDNDWYYNTKGFWQRNGGPREEIVELPPKPPPKTWKPSFGQTNQTEGCDIQC